MSIIINYIAIYILCQKLNFFIVFLLLKNFLQNMASNIKIKIPKKKHIVEFLKLTSLILLNVDTVVLSNKVLIMLFINYFIKYIEEIGILKEAKEEELDVLYGEYMEKNISLLKI